MSQESIFIQISVDNADSHPYICALFYGVLMPSLKRVVFFRVFRPGIPALNFLKKFVLLTRKKFIKEKAESR